MSTTQAIVKSNSAESKTTFKPRPSAGWVWVAALGLLLIAICLLNLALTGDNPDARVSTLLISGLTGLVGMAFILLALWFPTMRYEVQGSRLELKYGPVLHYTIDLKQVKRMRRCDLSIGMVSSIRFPGLALSSVPYPEVGVVKMCATASTHDILLIETKTGIYGITPADEQGFSIRLREGMEA